LICYESHWTNEHLLGKDFYIPKLYQIRQGNDERLCKDLNAENDYNKQWNGFILFHNIDFSILDVIIDIAGHMFVFYIKF